MKDLTVIAIDLSKSVFQVCAVNNKGQVMFNKAMTRKQRDTFLANQKLSIVAVEACGGAQYWACKVQKLGHIAKRLPPKQVAAIRQGQKTDVNDALAIAITARQPALKTAGIKTLDKSEKTGKTNLYGT